MRRSLSVKDCARVSFYSDSEHVLGYKPIYTCMVAKYAPMAAIIAKKDFVQLFYNNGREPFMFVAGHDSRESDKYFKNVDCNYEDLFY